jgi:hypothetical protein
MPSIKEVEKLDIEELLKWIKQRKPKLLNEENAQKFKNAYINGPVFLRHADDIDFFEKRCGLPPRVSDSLAYWVAEITGVKCKFLLCTSSRRLIMSQVTAIGRPTLPL